MAFLSLFFFALQPSSNWKDLLPFLLRGKWYQLQRCEALPRFPVCVQPFCLIEAALQVSRLMIYTPQKIRISTKNKDQYKYGDYKKLTKKFIIFGILQ